jgi:hypothetical protein
MPVTPNPSKAAFVSTGVVSRVLGVNQETVRAMIESGRLPEPQWMSLGSRFERVYSIEWLLLASEQVNLLRLPGLEHLLGPEEGIQFALRFDQAEWTVDEISSRLSQVDALWRLCVDVVNPDKDMLAPELTVRRLSAGSPLDFFAWVGDFAGDAAVPAAAATVMIYILRHPEELASAIPRAIASWRENWARADRARIEQVTARADRKLFELNAAALLGQIGETPSVTALNGPQTSNLELVDLKAIEAESNPAELDANQRDLTDAPASPESSDQEQ